MGTWAAGNFDNDAALDFVCGIGDVVKTHLNPPDEVEDIESLMAAVAVYKELVDHCRLLPPDRAEIVELRDRVLDVYDAEIDGLDPKPDFKLERRQVLERTFAEFLSLLEQ